MLNAMNGNSLWMEKEIENITEFSKVNLTALIPSVNWTLSKVMNENDTALDILRKVHSGIKTELETIMNSNKNTTIACETHLMLAKDNLNICEIDNTNIAKYALLKYQEMNLTNMKPRPILSFNATTTEIIKTMQTECKLLDQEFISARHEIKDSKEFLKSNFTSLIPSVNWSDMWDDNKATVEILKTVYGKLKNQNSKFFNESTKSMQELESNLTRIQDDLKFCKMENENISTLVSIQYQEMNSFKNKEYGRPMLGTNASTKEMLGTMQDECKWVDQELALGPKREFTTRKNL